MYANIELAEHLLEEGFSIILLTADGKKPTRKWKKYQTELATFADLYDWFVCHNFSPAIVTGELSGITVIDCDSDEADRAYVAKAGASPVKQRTRRGCHYVFRHDGERNAVKVGGMQNVDRRGEGGYVKAYEDCEAWTRDSIHKAPTIERVEQ